MARKAANGQGNSQVTSPRTLVVDPGSSTIKAGFAPIPSEEDPSPKGDCHIIPNCIARSRDRHVYTGSELEKCTDFGEMVFRRPVEKGYIVNWEAERAIWDHEFFQSGASLHCEPTETNLILTEPPNSPVALQSNNDQIVFEEFGFRAAYRTIGQSLNAWIDVPSLFGDTTERQQISPAEVLLLIDSGYSHTIITPLVHGRPIQPAIRRISIGGKHLTNYLAELISLRHFSLIDEPHIVSQIKEDACFVSQSFSSDLERTWKGGLGDRRDPDPAIVVDYVLPDYETLHRGFLRAHDSSHAAKMARLGVSTTTTTAEGNDTARKEEVFPLANERFVVPELLFSPSDIGLQESGIPETVMQCLDNVPRALWQGLLGNIMIVGGCSLLPGLVERVEAGVRMLAPAECVVRVRRAEDPITSTWHGGARLASRQDVLDSLLVTKEEYEENGPGWTTRQMSSRRIPQ